MLQYALLLHSALHMGGCGNWSDLCCEQEEHENEEGGRKVGIQREIEANSLPRGAGSRSRSRCRCGCKSRCWCWCWC